MTVGQEPSWCRPNAEYHKVIVQINNVRMVSSPLWRGPGNNQDRKSDKDRLLLKHQLFTPFPVCGYQR